MKKPVAEGMKRIYWTLSIGLVGCDKTGILDVDENSDDDQIDQDLRDLFLERHIEWVWSVKP